MEIYNYLRDYACLIISKSAIPDKDCAEYLEETKSTTR